MKSFLLFIAALSVYANAINCVEAYFKTKIVDYYIPGDYVLDSLYKAPKEGSESTPWFKKQYYTPGNHLPDSLVMQDESRIVKNVFHFTQEKTTENGLTKIVVQNDGKFYRSVEYFASADSISYVFTGVDLDEQYTEKGYFVLRNDTLFVNEFGHQTVVYLDSNNSNVCYDGQPGEDNFKKITYEAKGDIIHLTTDSEYSLTDLFFIPVNPGSTVAIRNIRSVQQLKKAQYFDLLGRPAQSKHSVQVPHSSGKMR